MPAGFGNDCGRVMAAYVEEPAQNAIISAHCNDGLSSNCRSDKFSGLFDLIDASDHLPGFAENGRRFEFGDARIDVPRSGNSRSFGQRRVGIVTGENFLHRSWHEHGP